MERLRLATLSLASDSFVASIIPSCQVEHFLWVGEVNDPRDLPALSAQVVLVIFQDFLEALATVESIRVAGNESILMVGPSVEANQVIAAMRVGVREVCSPAELPSALERAWFFHQCRKDPQTHSVSPSQQGHVVLVHSPKGGGGASTLAVNLAAVLQKKGEVALIDLCLNAGVVDLMLNLNPRTTWSDLADCKTIENDELELALIPFGKKGRLLSAPTRPEDGELIGVQLVDRVISAMRRRFQYTIIDTSSTLNEWTLRGMELADRILVPIPLTMPALRQVQRNLELWGRLELSVAKVEVFPWDQKGEVPLSAIEKILGRQVAHRLPYDTKGGDSAMNVGKPLVELEPNGSYAKAVTAISELVFGEAEPGHRFAPVRLLWQQVRRCFDVSSQQA